jgi:hypothetical protein
MKPHRMRMTHNLLLNYGLYRKMEVYRPHKATQVPNLHLNRYRVNFLYISVPVFDSHVGSCEFC